MCSSMAWTAITSGVTESFDAALDTAGDSTWSANVGGTSDWTFGSAQTPVIVSNSETPGITMAYAFDAAKATAVTNYQSAFSSSSNVTFEIWLKPDSNDTNQMIFECGGSGDGSAMTWSSGVLEVTSRNSNDFVTVSFEPLDLTDRHHQIIAVIEFDGSGGGTLAVYVDGVLVDTSTNSGFGDWSGVNGSGLGQTNGTSAPDIPFDDFTGEISIFRIYDNRALNASEVLANYAAIATAAPVLVIPADQNQNSIAAWDADDPGNDSANNWDVSYFVNSPYFNSEWVLSGGIKPTLTPVASSNYLFDQAYYFDGTGYGSSEDNLASTTNNMIFEVWLKPDDLSGQELLMEFGGSGDGVSLALDGTDFLFYANNTSSNVLQLRGDLSSFGTSEFIHCASFIDVDNNAAYMYLNGQQVSSDNIISFIDYDGGNTNGLGQIEGTCGLSGYVNYEGLISYIKITTRPSTEASITLAEANDLILNGFIEQHKGKGLIFTVE